MKKLLKSSLSLILIIIIITPTVIMAKEAETTSISNDVVTHKTTMTEDEIDAEHARLREEQIAELGLSNDQYVVCEEGLISPMTNEDYKTEYSAKKNATFSGYAGNQPVNGTRFPTGGGFYHSDSGGPTATVTVTFASPYGSIAFTAPLGNVGASSGVYVSAPTTTHYYKLWVTKTYSVQAYRIYQKVFNSSTWSWEWKYFSSGSTKVWLTTVASAKRV